SNLNLKGQARNGDITTAAQMNDPNLEFDADVVANLSGKYPAVKLSLELDSANLKPLNLLTDDVRIHGLLEADLSTADPDYLNGTITVANAIISNGGERYQIDSMSVVSTASADSSTLAVRSEVLSANVSGQYKLTQVGYALQDVIGKYFSIGNPVKPAAYTPQSMVFNAKLVNGPLITQFVPELKDLSTVSIDGRFNSASGELVVNALAPMILYGTNDINNLTLGINTGDEALNYGITIGSVSTPQLRLMNTSLTGKAQNNVLSTDLQVKDSQERTHYRIAGELRSDNPNLVFNLNPDGLMLNYESWTVSPGNQIRFGSAGVGATDFVLSNNNQRLSVNSTPPGLNNPLKIDFSNFQIKTLTEMVKKDSLLVGGAINGTALIRNFQTTPVFTADMNIDNFNFRGDTLGAVAIKVNNERTDIYNANVSITGEGNQLDLIGDYNTASSSFDMDLNIGNLNLKSRQGFTFGAIDSASGSVNGRLAIKGTAGNPRITGGVNFNKAAFNITMLNSYYKIQDNEVTFNDEGIRLNSFTLIDSAQNTAVVSGNIYTSTFTDYRFDLKVNADNFQVINSTKEDNELYYGKMFIDSDLSIGGSMNAPSVDGTLRVNDKTNFTLVLPQSDPAIEERQGIVEFIDMDNPELATILSSEIDSLNQSSLLGMDVSVNLEVDKAAEFNIVIDEANGDFLRLRGDADLNAGIDPSGKITLTGVYNLEEGEYELSFNFIKRRFEIEKGSTITWTGDVMTADIDVSAIYIANTAPLDLVENGLGDAPQAQRNTYKQKLPFEVNLTMKGELLKPIITFDIVLPERNYNVSTEVTSTVNTRLDQLRTEPSELNKQVFALLLLNRFVGENPFSSSAGGGGAETLARQSVSKILSQQLNNLAGDLIAGVELNFDLEATDDYTTGQRANRTDLNVGLSKRLLNDRLRVNIGSNFELEGPQQPGARTSNFAGDISVEYQLSRDGRYLLRAYQKNEYQIAIQGQVIETGVGFVITMDYNKFKEIFRARTDDTKRRRREERADKKVAKGND
ncbi:MAG: translocation/assembly module TamB domain-containing protein, partial [Daejeonella sp.]|uniref:translocation/assembly module TamB domain-containing protein n=1 Tax=Daejeonella sp. TaxID=2805397 RepID=UPI003C70810E